MYTLKSVSELTGLSAETLRAWERRYAAVSPRRDENRRRVYSAEQICRLRLLSEASRIGHPISKLVPLTDPELRALVDCEQLRACPGARFVGKLMDAVRDYRGDVCDEILGLAAATLTPLELTSQVLAPALREMGRRWGCGEMSIAQEHLLSSSIERMLVTLIHTHQKNVAGPGILFTTLCNERHRIGILLLAYIAATYRLRCHYFGADLPAAEIAVAADKTRSQVVAVSVVTRQDDAGTATLAALRDLSERLESRCGLWIGGEGASSLPAAQLPPRCVMIRDLAEYQQRLSVLAAPMR